LPKKDGDIFWDMKEASICQFGMGTRRNKRRGQPKDAWRRLALKTLNISGMASWTEAVAVVKDLERSRDGENVLEALFNSRRHSATSLSQVKSLVGCAQ